eukprot:2215799-Alexandrium_andersonii.AAC.1
MKALEGASAQAMTLMGLWGEGSLGKALERALEKASEQVFDRALERAWGSFWESPGNVRKTT